MIIANSKLRVSYPTRTRAIIVNYTMLYKYIKSVRVSFWGVFNFFYICFFLGGGRAGGGKAFSMMRRVGYNHLISNKCEWNVC